MIYNLIVTFEYKSKQHDFNTNQTIEVTHQGTRTKQFSSKLWLDKMIASGFRQLLPRWRTTKAISYRVEEYVLREEAKEVIL